VEATKAILLVLEDKNMIDTPWGNRGKQQGGKAEASGGAFAAGDFRTETGRGFSRTCAAHA
jgi:hypothetical protein